MKLVTSVAQVELPLSMHAEGFPGGMVLLIFTRNGLNVVSALVTRLGPRNAPTPLLP